MRNYSQIYNTMDIKQYNALFSFIWNIANEVLAHVFEKDEMRLCILQA